jgi:disintegrin and metalloproteinase domain-containing protein 10
LALVGDVPFFTGPDGRSDVTYAMSNMINRVPWVDNVYQSTPFNGVKGYGFLIGKVILYNTTGNGNPVAGSSYTADAYLKAFSDARIWRPYCLAHMFTYRGFEDGILGLAWVGEPGSSGGICDSSNYNTVRAYLPYHDDAA